MSSQTCQIFWVLCLLTSAIQCWGNSEAWCDCERLNHMLNAHTKHLSELVGYERKTERLIEWQKKFSASNTEEENGDVTPKLKGIEDFIAALKTRTKKIEDELAEYRNITQKLDSWIEGSDILIANVVRTILQSATRTSDVEEITTASNPDRVEAFPERISLRRTAEQTIFEQMKLIVANLTTEMAILRNYKVPRLESRVAAIEADLSANREF